MNALVLLVALTVPTQHHAIQTYNGCGFSIHPSIQSFPGGTAITYPRPGPLRNWLFGPAARVIVTNPVQGCVPITVPPSQPQIIQAPPAACPPVNLPIQIRPSISPPVVLPSEPPAKFRDIVDFELDLTVLESIRDLKENMNENDIRLLERLRDSEANIIEKIRDSDANIIERIRQSDNRLLDKIGELVPVPQPGEGTMSPEQVLARLLELNEAQLQALIAITEQLKAVQNGNQTAIRRTTIYRPRAPLVPVKLGRE